MKRLLYIVGWLLLSIFLLFGGIFLFFKSTTGQQWLSKKVSSFASNYLHTDVKATIRYGIPDWVILENVLIQDQSQDTLLASNSLRIDLDMWALLQSEVKINQVELEGATIGISRKSTSKNFNYSFLLDAFTSDTTQPDTTSSKLLYQVRSVTLKNIKLKYKDEKLNNNATLKLVSLKTGFDELDPANERFFLKDIEVDGLQAFANFTKANEVTTKENEQITTPSKLKLNFRNVKLENASWDVRFADLASKAKVKMLGIDVEEIKLTEQSVKFSSLELDAPLLSYDDLVAPKKLKGFDAGHIAFTNLIFDAKNIFGSADSSVIDLRKLAFIEKSGVAIQKLEGRFSYLPTKFIAEQLNLQTPHSKLGNYIEIRHPKLTEIVESLEKAIITIELKDSHIGLQDVEAVSPESANNVYFKKAKKDKVYIEARLTGQLEKLTVSLLDIHGLNGGRLLVKGQLLGLPTLEKLQFDTKIEEFSTSKTTLTAFLPDSILTSFGIPNKVKLFGKLSGTLKNITTNLTLKSDIGNGIIEGNFKDFINSTTIPKYNGNVVLNGFDLNYLLKDSTLRTATINLAFNGKGLDPRTMETQINGLVSEAYYNGYTYRNIRLAAGLNQNKATFIVNSEDVNLDGSLNGSVNLTSEFPTVNAVGSFERLDLKALGFYAEPLIIKGGVDVDMLSTNPSLPIGTIKIQNGAVNQGNGFVEIGKANVVFNQKGAIKTVKLLSDFLKLNLKGMFDYSTVSDVVLTQIAAFFKPPMAKFSPVTTPSKFELEFLLNNHPLVQTFIPELTDFKPISFTTIFDNTTDKSIASSLRIPYVVYDSIAIKDVSFDLSTNHKLATYSAVINEVESSSFRLRKGTLKGEIKDNIAGFVFTVKDSVGNDVHGLAGNLTAIDNYYRIMTESNGTLLYYEPWQTDGAIEIHPTGIIANAVRFMSGTQLFGLSSTRPEPNAPISVTTKQINLKQLATAFLQDSTLISGLLNAKILVENLDSFPTFTGDFGVKELALTQIAIGELSANAANKGDEAITLNASLTGKGNDFRVIGSYLLNGENPLDMTLDIRRLKAETIQAFSFGELSRAKGQLNGQLKLTGKTEAPIIKGTLFFEKFDFVLAQLGAPYTIQNQKAIFKGQYMELDKFVISDSLGQKLITTGQVLFPNLPNYSYKLNVQAKNFLAANAQRNDNEYFYGIATVDASLGITGVNEKYIINGDVKVVPGSKVVVLMPEDESLGSEMEQLINFVNPKEKKDNKGAKLDKKLSTASSSSEITLNVDVTEGSELTVLIDELTGDYLRVKGNGKLRTGFNASGELFLFGDYIITEGAYELSVSLVRKKFDVMNGSYIRWIGDPLAGEVNIKAAYKVETSLADYLLPESTLPAATKDALKRPIPITLLLYLKNNLLALKPSFAVAVYEENLTARGITNIDDIRKEGITVIDEEGGIKEAQLSRFINDNYINQQALWLLASNRFSPFQNNSSFGGGFNAEATVRQSVSKLLSDQLDRLASGIIKGVDLSVGIASDYATETGDRSTELNLGVSKAFLNDRLSISVGRNFELEDAQRQSSEIFDNITAAYKLSEDGRYRFKAYRKNQYQTVLEGFVVETGVGFVVTLEYDKVLEIFKRKESEENIKIKDERN